MCFQYSIVKQDGILIDIDCLYIFQFSLLGSLKYSNAAINLFIDIVSNANHLNCFANKIDLQKKLIIMIIIIIDC